MKCMIQKSITLLGTKYAVAMAVLCFAFVMTLSNLSLASGKDKKAPESLEDELKFKIGDEQGNEIKALKTELLINESDEKALAQLKKLLKRYKGSGMEASLQFRLAEIYMRRAKSATFFEVHRDDQNVVRFVPNVTKSASSRGWITKAVSTYDEIEKRFTHFRDMDLVLFNNAFAREILGQNKQAVERYRKVIEDYSSSPLVPDCHLAIGESLFNDRAFQASFDEFQKIREFPDSRVYPYGLYKGAWSLYNLHRAADALKQLEEVVSYSKLPKEEGVMHLDLSREALDDMVVFFEDVKQPPEAVSYFREQAGNQRASELILKLGKLYGRHSRYANIAIIYGDLIAALPNAPERPEMHRTLAEGFEITKDRAKAVEHLEALSSLCNKKSTWWVAQKREDQQSCDNHLEEITKLYAAKWHKDFRKNQDQKLAQFARRAFEALLKSDIQVSEEDKYRFDYAELLFQTGSYRDASREYSKVAHLTKDSKMRHDSSYGALVALEKAVGDKWPDNEEQEFNRLADDYLKMNPKGDYVTDIRFKKAFIAYDKGRFADAGPQFRALAFQFNGSDRGKKAAVLYLDILNLQKDYAKLRDESQLFVKRLKLDNATKDQFAKIHQQAGFTVVQSLEVAEKYNEAIQGYLNFIKEQPNAALADKALYNAIRCANLSGDLTRAANLAERLLAEYPTSAFKMELVHNLVTLYEAQAQLGLAGRTLIRLAEWEPDKARSHLLAGADYKALNNEWDQALQVYTQLAQKNVNTEEGKIALERLAAFAEKNHQDQKQIKLLDQIVSLGRQPQASLASFKLAQIAYAENNEDKAFKLAKKTIALRNEKKVSVYALAQARLIQAKILEHEFDMASVKARPDRLATVLAIKTEKLEHAQKAYQDTIAFGDRSTAIEALVHMAKIFGKFSQALNTIQPPADAPEGDKKKFSAEIENMAIPIEEKYAETLQLALKQAKSLELHDAMVASIQLELNRLSKRTVAGQPALEIAVPENVLPVVN